MQNIHRTKSRVAGFHHRRASERPNSGYATRGEPVGDGRVTPPHCSANPRFPMLSPGPDPRAASAALIDTEAVAADLARTGRARVRRARAANCAPRVAQHLKAALAATAAKGAEEMLLKDRHGRRCAETAPARCRTSIIRVLFEFVGKHLPRRRYPVGSRAHGGGGDRRLRPRAAWRRAPTSICCSCCPTSRPRGASRSPKRILYCLWDMGLKVGHATRSVDECIRQAKADMTIRTAIARSALPAGRPGAVRRAGRRASTSEVVKGTGAANSSPPSSPSARTRHRRSGQSRYLVEPNVKDGKGGLRDLHTLFWIAKYVYRVREPEELVEHGVFDPDELRAVPALRGLSLVGALPPAFRHRPRRGAPVVRHPARDRGAARLHRASRHAAGCRALHEALLPDRQGCRRPDRDPVRRAGRAHGKAGAPVLEPRDGAAAADAAGDRCQTEDFIVDNNRINIADARRVPHAIRST